MNFYPLVFVHGFNGWGEGEGINGVLPYWGATTGDLVKYLRREGFDAYSASVGPVSSAWDRACELYAQLTGGTVDYGEAHSKKHGHRRFGRTYDKPVIDGWGEKDENGNVRKIHLIGHSFGGNTIRLLDHLLINGSKEELDASGEDVSPLFRGGHGGIVESITTICTPHNSSSIYKLVTSLKLFDLLLVFTAIYTGTLGRSALNGKMVDFHLEQFGLSNTPGRKDADSYFRSIRTFLKNSEDTCENDLLPESIFNFNKTVKTNENTYYFSYPFDSTKQGKITGLRIPILKSNPVIAPLGYWIALQKEFTNNITGQVYNDEWRPNDLLCNTVSEKYPLGEAHKDYDKNVSPEKGVWYVMPVQTGDHGTAIGLFANKEKTRAFYLSLADLLRKLN
ncbi:MAG: hypothetical protein IJK60_01425 [Clostridia bacterium]|nr:hypothetical protein [Clostridia bacterium]